MLAKIPSQPFLHEWLDYNSETGIFSWKKEPRPDQPLVNRLAGTKRKSGYVYIKVRGFPPLGAHRLAWIYVHGMEIDRAEIDHIDGDRSNNAVSNLRLATSAQQKQNRCAQANIRSGLKGAFYDKHHRGKKWRSQIRVGNSLHFLGCFQTAEEAHEAYRQAAVKYFGEFAAVRAAQALVRQD